MKKRLICIILAAVMIFACMATTAFASTSLTESIAEELAAVGVFRGTDTGFDLDRAPNRSEAATMLVRLYGAEQEAQRLYEEGWTDHPFADAVGWQAPYVAWLYTKGLTRGVSDTAFGAFQLCSGKQYVVFLLRALGYEDDVDFSYEYAEILASSLGFYSESLFSGTFLRGDLALMTYYALGTRMKDSDCTLLAYLIAEGAIDEEDAESLSKRLSADNRLTGSDSGIVLNPADWYQNCQDMTIYVEIFNGGSVLPSGTEMITGRELSALVSTDRRGDLVIQDSILESLVATWAKKYNRTGVPYQFDSYVKGITSIDFIKRDYKLDEAELVKALKQQILSGQSGTIRTKLTCLDNNGNPWEIASTHVEVDIDNQQLTFIKNGQVLVNTNIVTGNLLTGHATPTGLFSTHSKETNATLTGPDYEVFVKYWVAVIGNMIGLHDANWRSNFGSDYYVNGGSHGCINIPESAMVIIFNNIDDGTPVLIHGQNRWYEPFSGKSPATVNPARGTTAR